MACSTRWSPRNFPASPLHYIPLAIQLSNPMKGTLDYLHQSELVDLWGLVQKAAREGNNVGLDEFASFDDIVEVLQSSEAFMLREDGGAGALHGAIIINPWIHRSNTPNMARLFVIVDKYLRTKEGAFLQLVRVAQQLACDLGIGYESCFISVFVTCPDLYRAMREDGFTTSVIVPYSGYYMKKGLVPSYLMTKPLPTTDKEFSLDDVMAYTNGICKGSEFDQGLVYPEYSCLPVDYTMKNGRKITLRSMRGKEEAYVHNLYAESAKAGVGYALDEVPTLQYYKEHVLTGVRSVIIEDSLSAQRLGVFQTSASWLNRSAEMPLGDLDMILDPCFKGQGHGLELNSLGLALVKKAGYKGLLTDIFETNYPVLRLTISNKFTHVGILPKTAYLAGEGWADSLFCFKHSDHIASLEELVAMSGKRPSKI